MLSGTDGTSIQAAHWNPSSSILPMALVTQRRLSDRVTPWGGIGKPIRDGDDLPSWTAGSRDGCSCAPISSTVTRFPAATMKVGSLSQ